jgi:hypothetical protein
MRNFTCGLSYTSCVINGTLIITGKMYVTADHNAGSSVIIFSTLLENESVM